LSSSSARIVADARGLPRRQRAAAISDCQFVEITGAGNSIGLNNPADFDSAVRSFLLG
jgi:hypothetical protein